MAATALVAARVEPELKQRAKTVLDRKGVTESQLIRRVYEYVVHTGDIPEFVLVDDCLVDTAAERPGKFGRLIDFAKDGPFSSFDWSSLEMDPLEDTLAERDV